jgi:hypothetical protein
MMIRINCFSAVFITITVAFLLSCSGKRGIQITTQKIAPNSSIAIIVDHPNNIKNVIVARFMSKRFRVKAFNASDLYSLKDVFDIRDFKKVSFNTSLMDDKSLLSMEKTYDNIYKLHVYNFEMNKAQLLTEMKEKWKVRYLVLLDLKNWEEVSWGRAIDLYTYEVIWIENYPARFNDTVETVVDHFIRSMSGL